MNKIKKMQAYNPYLPGHEYIPDAEPYVIGDRVYIYGSHDRFDGDGFCLNNYVCWSAPVNELGNWRFEGEIYQKQQEPLFMPGKELYAPAMQQGADGRYYLFYALNGAQALSVAVCDTPAGQYEFYGHVKYPSGVLLGESTTDPLTFDPAVLVEDGKVYLYIGFSPWKEFLERYPIKHKIDGAYVMELESDMLTIKEAPTLIVPGLDKAQGTPFQGHEFFEASSIRKVNGKYYFIYSSIQMHELCYAISEHPDGDFVYGGCIISNGDVFTKEGKNSELFNYAGNNHGSIVEIQQQWYVFYHRQTNFHQFSRQDCAEPITIAADGSIAQVELTSCGLNGGALAGKGRYEARIACNLFSATGAIFYPNEKTDCTIHPYFTQDQPDTNEPVDQYIKNIHNGAVIGFKYFDFVDTEKLSVWMRGSAQGDVICSTSIGGSPVAQITIQATDQWREFSAPLSNIHGVYPLFFSFHGTGSVDFLAFSLS